MTPLAPTSWLVRLAGDPEPRPLDAPEKVLDGLREGDWEPSDEVRGPGERLWVPIEEHPVFADAVAAMGPPPAEPEDETKLDMNPLIDVALVLLIFFILTATVATLRRTIDVPPPLPDEAGSPIPQSPPEDLVFHVTVTLDEQEHPVVQIEQRVILFDRLEDELKEVKRTTGRNEMILKMQNDVTWETEVQIRSAAAAADIRHIYIPGKKLK